MKTLLIASLACTLCAAALAQAEPDTNAYDGKWNVSAQAGGGRPFAATLTLAEFGGSWQDNGTGATMKAKACKGRKFPVTVQASISTVLEFTVWGSAVDPGCPNLSVTVKPASEKVLEGSLASGEALRLTRR